MQRREPATYHSGCSEIGTPHSKSLPLPSYPRITEKGFKNNHFYIKSMLWIKTDERKRVIFESLLNSFETSSVL